MNCFALVYLFVNLFLLIFWFVWSFIFFFLSAAFSFFFFLSWHSRRNGFFWYRNVTLNTSVAESLVERPDSWICFVVRRNTKRVIPEYCDTLHHFLCENADDGKIFRESWSKYLFTNTGEKRNSSLREL